jgi:hypothetical protein
MARNEAPLLTKLVGEHEHEIFTEWVNLLRQAAGLETDVSAKLNSPRSAGSFFTCFATGLHQGGRTLPTGHTLRPVNSSPASRGRARSRVFRRPRLQHSSSR